MLVDSVLVPVAAFATLIAGDALGVTQPFAKVMLIVMPIFILEPALVAFTGGTVGHHLLKLRITRLDGKGNINILAATARFIVKLLLGSVSLIFVLTTRKHQAVHDLVARSLVVHKDINGLPTYDVLSERKNNTEKYAYPPAWRRVIVAIAYCVLVLILVNVLAVVVISSECTRLNICNTKDMMFSIALGLIWLGATGWVIIQSWGGRVFGCRRRRLVRPHLARVPLAMK